MKPLTFGICASLTTLTSAALLCAASSPPHPVQPAPARPMQTYCWTIQSRVCTDCNEHISTYCDPDTGEGIFSSCVEKLIDPCETGTCMEAMTTTGPPCS